MAGLKQITLTWMFLCLFIYNVVAQPPFVYIREEKYGACPPPRLTQECTEECRGDMDCEGNSKCCPTKCGTSCASPVTEVVGGYRIKAGRCPDERVMPWQCSDDCQSDIDCVGDKKCCKSRCGGHKCVKAVIA